MAAAVILPGKASAPGVARPDSEPTDASGWCFSQQTGSRTLDGSFLRLAFLISEAIVKIFSWHGAW